MESAYTFLRHFILVFDSPLPPLRNVWASQLSESPGGVSKETHTTHEREVTRTDSVRTSTFRMALDLQLAAQRPPFPCLQLAPPSSSVAVQQPVGW